MNIHPPINALVTPLLANLTIASLILYFFAKTNAFAGVENASCTIDVIIPSENYASCTIDVIIPSENYASCTIDVILPSENYALQLTS